MAKTLDIDNFQTLSHNSAVLVGKDANGNMGWLEKVFTEDGKFNDGTLATKDELTNLATKDEVNACVKTEKLNELATKEEVKECAKTSALNDYLTITSASSTYETKADAENHATKSDLNQYVKITIQQDGNTAYMNNEWNGGLMKLTTKEQKMSKVTLYDGSDDANTYIQLIVKDEGQDAGQVARINGTLTGFFYNKTKENANQPTDEIATLGDVYQRTMQELTGLASGDKAKIQNQTNGGVMQYVKADGANNAVCVNNGSGDNGVGVELCALNSTGNGARIILNDHGAYYTVKNDASFTDDNMLVTKSELESLKSEMTKLQKENTELKASLAEATKTVNEYTEKVSTLVEQQAAAVGAKG